MDVAVVQIARDIAEFRLIAMDDRGTDHRQRGQRRIALDRAVEMLLVGDEVGFPFRIA
jgi:hypothetical protein